MIQALSEAESARQAGKSWLDAALQASRRDTLATFAVVERGLQGLRVPQRETFNPPLWELGHIGWFQEYWLARNPARAAGAEADPAALRLAGLRPNADALYDSSAVPHATRWSLPLPRPDATRRDLEHQLETTLALLGEASDDQASLYFFRLALLHEDMHHEAALYMTQSLGLAIDDPRWQAEALAASRRELSFDAGHWDLGHSDQGFAFDNELAANRVELPATRIDCRVVRWDEYLPFVEAGGYSQPQWWTETGAAWLAAEQAEAPRYLRRESGRWEQWRHGAWRELDLRLAACHMTAHEAQAWCRWAGRRLPTEAEWERAAVTQPEAFEWGQVWEWTASPFLPYPGFAPHPYRDYSAPWFGNRVVLRGASFMTQPRMRHPRYRNFFASARNDVAAGFRSCAA